MRPRVAIVAATYNGARHIEEQLESLRAQDHRDWRLFVRDDGSSDATPEILARASRSDERITVLESSENLGVVGNFGALLSQAHASGADLVFTCDQDDVWLPTKVSRSLALVSRLEAAHGASAPLLVHSDLRVVDERLALIHPSFLAYQGIAHEEAHPLEVLLVQNFVTGCTAVMNRPLLDVALPLPGSCIIHDWWLAQCAAACGTIGFVPEATILYRQHSANQIGANGALSNLGNLNVLHAQGRKRFARSWKTAVRTVWQARALHARLVERGGATAAALALIDGYGRIDSEGAARRLRTMWQLGIRRHRPFDTVQLYARMSLLGIAAGTPRD